MRMLFGTPIRKSTTEIIHPEKISLLEFSDLISGIGGFIENIRHLGHDNGDLYPEEWAEIFLAYLEIEREE